MDAETKETINFYASEIDLRIKSLENAKRVLRHGPDSWKYAAMILEGFYPELAENVRQSLELEKNKTE